MGERSKQTCLQRRHMANSMKRYPSLIITGMQIKTTMRYHITLVQMAIIKSLSTVNPGEGVGKREPSCNAGGNLNSYSHCGGQCRGSLKN